MAALAFPERQSSVLTVFVSQKMKRVYEYHGHAVEVSTEAGFRWQADAPISSYGFIAIVRISRAGATLAQFSPLRLGDSGGHSFMSEAEALMGGYSAGRRLVDDLLNSETA
jgi:hypothetical protein